MINLELATPQEFSTPAVPGTLQFQNWGFSPESFLEVNSYIGAATPSDITVATNIKNYIASLGTDKYSEFRVAMDVVYYQEMNTVSFLDVTGDIPEASGEGLLVAEDNLNVDTVISFVELSQLYQSSWKAMLKFIVKGKLATDEFEVIETIEYYVTLNRLGSKDIVTFPGVLNFSHLIGETLPSPQNISIAAIGNFNVTVEDHFVLSGGNLVFEEEIEGVKHYTGSDSQEISVTLESSIETLGATKPFYEALLQVSNTAGLLDITKLRAHQFTTADFSVNTQNISFKYVKGFNTSEKKSITLSGIGSFSVSGPSWLTIFPSSGTDFAEIEIKPIAGENLSPGTYEANIVVTTTGDDIIIPVSTQIIDTVELGAVTKGVNFTKDTATITRLYNTVENLDAFKYALTTQYFSMGELVSDTKVANFKQGLFQDKGSFFMGPIIHRIMAELLRIESIGFFTPNFVANEYGGDVFKYYNPSVTNLLIQYYNRETGIDSFESKFIPNIKFIKGRKPKRSNNYFGILDVNNSMIRVTPKSRIILNFFALTRNPTVSLYRNGVFVTRFPAIIGNHQVLGIEIFFNYFTPGDIIEAKLLPGGTSISGVDIIEGEYSQFYIVYPPGKHRTNVYWVNEHDVLDSFEFTGDFIFSTEHNEIVASVYEEFIENLRKYDSIKTAKFTINTGFIPQDNQERIDSLVASKKAWIENNNEKDYITLIPRSSSLVLKDTDQENYQFTVEFSINLRDELENNTL